MRRYRVRSFYEDFRPALTALCLTLDQAARFSDYFELALSLPHVCIDVLEPSA